MQRRSQDAESERLQPGANDRPDLSTQPWRVDHTSQTTVTYHGHEFRCSRVASPSGEWSIAFGRAADGSSCRVFGFHGDELAFARPVTRPTEAWIANDGTAIVVDGEGFEASGGSAVIVGSDGEPIGGESFDSNVHGAAITADGSHAAIVTLNPDGCLYLYDTSTGDRQARHEFEHGRRHGVILEKSNSNSNSRVLAYIVDDATERLLYAVTPQNDIVWRSEYVQSRVPFLTRILNGVRDRF